jgi:hypothetical protein
LLRDEIDPTTSHPRWVETMTPATAVANGNTRRYLKRVADLMSDHVISVGEDASLTEVAAILERNRIKRVPIARDHRLVGIVSRSNLIQALASAAVATERPSDESRSIREELLARLREQSWTDFGSRNVIVKDGEVHLWGLVGSEAEREALVTVAEGVPGVTKVVDETILMVWSDPNSSRDNKEDDGVPVATVATLAVVGAGAAIVEAALVPGIILGAAAVLLPKAFPAIGDALNFLFRSTVRGAYKIGQIAAEP